MDDELMDEKLYEYKRIVILIEVIHDKLKLIILCGFCFALISAAQPYLTGWLE